MASGGTRLIEKNRCADQKKMKITMASGTSDQVSSSASDPMMAAGRSPSERRRKRTANTITAVKIRALKKIESAHRKMKSASTWEAVVEAASGNSGSPLNMD